jgi:thioredoxin 1
MQTPIIIAIVALLAVGGIYMASTNDTQEAVTQNTEETAKTETEKETIDDVSGVPGDAEKAEIMKKEEMMKKEETAAVAPATAGAYLPYDATKLAMAETGDVVLFFHATWCPGCRALDSDITAQLSAIPSDLTILKLDYDTETELKKKYGVTTQQTLVQVDAQGNLIKKWSGSTKLAQVVEMRN